MNNSNLRLTVRQYVLPFPTITRFLLSLLLLAGSLSIFAQAEGVIVHNVALKNAAPASSKAFNPFGEVSHGHPLVLANDVVIRMDQVKINLLDSVSVVRHPDSSSHYGNAAINGIINLKTRQKFGTIVLENVHIPNARRLTGEKKFILNGYLINNPSIKISKSAIKKVEVIDSNDIHYISIWTLTEDEKKPVSALCNFFQNTR